MSINDREEGAVESQSRIEGERALSPALPVSASQEWWNPTLLVARFPQDLHDPIALQQFTQVCLTTGLNPFLAEIVPMFGRPYVTEVGWLRLVDERAPGQMIADDVRLGTKEERNGLGITARGWLAVCTVVRRLVTANRELVDRKTVDMAFLSWASVNDSKMDNIREEPWRQAMKIAHVRALRRAFPDVLHGAIGDLAIEGDYDIKGEATAAVEEITEKEAINAERRRFWARANQLGIKNGSAELANLLNLPVVGVGAMKEHWLDAGRSWFDANVALDEWEAAMARAPKKGG